MMTRRLLWGALVCALVLVAGCGDTTYEFDPVVVGDDDDSTRAPREKSNQQFLRSVYADLIGRAPEVYDVVISDGPVELGAFQIDEQEFLLGSLDSVGDSRFLRGLITAGLVRHAEVDLPDKGQVDDPDQFIRDQFRRFLGREPNSYELRGFRDGWDTDDAVNPRTVVRALIDSREYQSF